MAGEKTADRVTVTVAFSNAQIGHKEVGDEFDYDLRGDPLGLRAEGKVAKAKLPEIKA